MQVCHLRSFAEETRDQLKELKAAPAPALDELQSKRDIDLAVGKVLPQIDMEAHTGPCIEDSNLRASLYFRTTCTDLGWHMKS